MARDETAAIADAVVWALRGTSRGWLGGGGDVRYISLEALLRLPRARRIALGEEGRRRLVAEFSLARCTSRYAALYEDVASIRSRPRLGSSAGADGVRDRADRGRTPSSAGRP